MIGPTQYLRFRSHHVFKQTSTANYAQPDDQAAHSLFEHYPLATHDCQFPAHSRCEVFASGPFHSPVQTFSAIRSLFIYDMVYVSTECITSTYNSCLHAVWTPTVLTEDVLVETSSEERHLGLIKRLTEGETCFESYSCEIGV